VDDHVSPNATFRNRTEKNATSVVVSFDVHAFHFWMFARSSYVTSTVGFSTQGAFVTGVFPPPFRQFLIPQAAMPPSERVFLVGESDRWVGHEGVADVAVSFRLNCAKVYPVGVCRSQSASFVHVLLQRSLKVVQSSGSAIVCSVIWLGVQPERVLVAWG